MNRMSQAIIEERWGIPFWQLLADFADQGLPRSTACKALGYSRCWFYQVLRNNPDKDPFPDVNIVAAYSRDTGETLKAAVTRMVEAGYTGRRIAREVGYTDWSSLRRTLEGRGIDFPLPKKRIRRHCATTKT